MFPDDPLWAGVLFLGAILGHAALVFRSHNLWYGSGLSRKTVDVLQLLHALLLLAGPVVFWLALRFQPRVHLFSQIVVWPDLLLVYYVQICWFVGCIVVPAVTAHRQLRRCPALLGEERTKLRIAD